MHTAKQTSRDIYIYSSIYHRQAMKLYRPDGNVSLGSQADENVDQGWYASACDGTRIKTAQFMLMVKPRDSLEPVLCYNIDSLYE